jgi:hypothetical protein
VAPGSAAETRFCAQPDPFLVALTRREGLDGDAREREASGDHAAVQLLDRIAVDRKVKGQTLLVEARAAV